MTVGRMLFIGSIARLSSVASAGSVPPVALNWPSGGRGRGLAPEGGIPI
jgi:hypothetical protein